jgi:hypothetical protein
MFLVSGPSNWRLLQMLGLAANSMRTLGLTLKIQDRYEEFLVELAVMVDVGSVLSKAAWALEGDGPLLFTMWTTVQRLREWMKKPNLPRLIEYSLRSLVALSCACRVLRECPRQNAADNQERLHAKIQAIIKPAIEEFEKLFGAHTTGPFRQLLLLAQAAQMFHPGYAEVWDEKVPPPLSHTPPPTPPPLPSKQPPPDSVYQLLVTAFPKKWLNLKRLRSERAQFRARANEHGVPDRTATAVAVWQKFWLVSRRSW